jgi:tyrosyl-tRNA synthetase
MTAFKSDFLNILQERGFIHQCSDFEGLDALAAKGEAIAYVGYDCTARSLHIGNYLTMMMLHWLQESGNKPITLMGGGTTMVGDPSGKDETRAMRTVAEIEDNKASIRGVFAKVLRYGEGKSDAIMLDNAEWLTKLNWIEMLRDVGRHFSVNRMLTMDSVRLRLEREQEMSFIEFNYMVCQAYDFVELAKRTGCKLQMGGSDQWGNIIMGVDLGRRMGTHQLFALTTPLLTTASGAKMGKTAQGAVWLNADQFSPYDFWQYWRNTEDADVGKFLKLFTTLPMAEIRKLEALAARRSTRPRRCSPLRRPRCCTAAMPQMKRQKLRAALLRKARLRRVSRPWKFRAANSTPASAYSVPSSRQASSPPTARRGGRSKAAACV